MADVEEVVSKETRKKMARNMAKIAKKSSTKLKKARAAMKVATPEKIQAKAAKKAKDVMVGKLIGDKKWEVYINSGRDKTGLNAIEWAKKLIDLGVGELMVVSIDKDGTLNGPDYDLISAISKFCNIPLIVGGGIGTLKHVEKILDISNPSGIYVSSVLHYNKLKIKDFKKINV